LRNYLIAANGNDYLEAVGKCVSELVSDSAELVDVIDLLLLPDVSPVREKQLYAQHEAYPAPEKGLVLKTMADAITHILVSKSV
jgi:hypothetical protein